MCAIAHECSVQNEKPASTEQAASAREQAQARLPWCDMNHVQRHDGIKWRVLFDAPCFCAHIDVERWKHVAQASEFDPARGAGASVGIRIAREPSEVGHRFGKMHDVLAGPTADLQDYAM